uniref:type IV secretory system conjugative DNA transfer family protein n=1 Tax=Acetatifactor sp. TaxID=1872090 RepID=UPI004055FC90
MAFEIIKGVMVEDNPLLNDNICVVGNSGSGKTTQYVDARIRNCRGRIIVADTKSNLYEKYRDVLIGKGYRVELLDFNNLSNSTVGYNPLRYIKHDVNNGYKEEDVVRIAKTLIPIRVEKDPFWEQTAQIMIESMIAYMLESDVGGRLKNLTSIGRFLAASDAEGLSKRFEHHKNRKGDTFAVRKYNSIKQLKTADKTYASVLQFVNTALADFDSDSMLEFFNDRNLNKFDIKQLADRKMALFININDNMDFSRERLINLFYTQVFQELIRYADSCGNNCLRIPVHIVLDDFACGVSYIHGFEKIMNIIRSRGISVSMILQSFYQLNTLYTDAQSKAILNSFDRTLVLGINNEYESALYVAQRTQQAVQKIFSMPLDTAILFTRGEKPQYIKKDFSFEKEYELQVS